MKSIAHLFELISFEPILLMHTFARNAVRIPTDTSTSDACNGAVRLKTVTGGKNAMRTSYLLKAKQTLVAGTALVTALLCSILISTSSALAITSASSRMKLYAAAASEFGVPVDILLAVSYNQTRWQDTSGTSVDGGLGPMNLRTSTTTHVSGRDGSAVQATSAARGPYTVDRAAQILHVSADSLKTDTQLNIRGGAAVLADQARKLHQGHLPADPADWYDTVASTSGATTTDLAASFADSVFSSLRTGANATLPGGQTMRLSAHAGLQPHKNMTNLLSLGLKAQATTTPAAECPATLNCQFVPAAYTQNNPNDPSDYGNYDTANRPADMAIKYIYIHDTEGSYDSAIAHFQDPTSYVSAQYVVRASDGAITQMVRNKDVSWGVYNWYDNMHGINIETEGFAAQGASWYTPVMYQKEAELVRYLAAKYHIPLDREHILGHDNIPVLRAAITPYQHWDPGPYWNWTYFMDLVHGLPPAAAQADSEHHMYNPMPIRKNDVVTIAPTFATNQPVVTDCSTGTCTTLPPQGTNFVYLHTQPNNNAPLINDANLHPDSTQSTTDISDWGGRAPTGFKYVVADVKGDWTAIWFAGQMGWFYNPHGAGQTAERSMSLTVTPKAGATPVYNYGGAAPEDSAYPANIPPLKFTPLYTLGQGQKYPVTLQNLPTDDYYAMTIDSSLPGDHTVVHGKQKYYQISVNHRIGYVKADEVTVNFQ